MQRRIFEEKHIMGANMSTNRSGATFHYYFGKTVGALPNGRKAWLPLADGSLSPVQGSDLKGPTAVINSASKVNHTEINRNTLLNMKIPPSLIKTREGKQKFISLIKTYFDRGGYHIQFNLIENSILLDAKKHPENYRDLLVRVAGYSTYFVDLLPEVQDEIIARTAQPF
jgi:formate C-acetyltransferase